MGLLGYVYKFLGFEGDDVKASKKKKGSQKASYNLKVQNELPDEIDGVRVFYPEKFEDCKDKVELLKKDVPFFLDFRSMSAQEKNKVLDYYEGVLDVLGATEEVVEKDLYIFLPKNMEIER